MNPDIDQDGFEDSGSKVTRIKNEGTPNNNTAATEKKPMPSSSGGGDLFSKRNLTIAGAAVCVLAVLGAASYFGTNTSLKSAMPTDTTVAGGNPFAGGKPAPEPKIEIGNEGVMINGQRDQVATLLLENYPTRSELQSELERIRGAEVSQEELDVFLLAVKHNSEAIARLNSKPQVDLSRVTSRLDDMRGTLNDLKGEVSGMKEVLESNSQKIDKLEKNSGWYHNRISALEGNPVAVKKKGTTKAVKNNASSARRLQMTTESSWVVNGAASNLAFISNINTNKKLRVTLGFDIPGCGQVTHIDPSEQKVVATSCVIKN